MDNLERKYKSLLRVILVVLFLPIIQSALNLLPLSPLKGAITPAPRPEFTIDSWWDGTFQEPEEKWLNENFGFRSTLVRLRNQIGWSIYGKGYADGVIKGIDGYLLDEGCIHALNGEDYRGRDTLLAEVELLRLLQDTLAMRGKLVVTLLAPGKSSFYKEFIPAELLHKERRTNYEDYAYLMKDKHLNYLDFNNWFLTMKPQSEFPLFPKGGFHWSVYGATLAMDSLIGYLNYALKDSLPRFIFDRIEYDDELAEVDKDLVMGLNLLVEPSMPPMPYGKCAYGKIVKKKRPSILFVSDSYFWTLPLHVLENSGFSAINLLYYNKELYPIDRGSRVFSDARINRDSLIAQTDIIILLATDGNLKAFPWNFAKQVLHRINVSETYLPINMQHPGIIERMKKIREDKNWFENIRKDAIRDGVPLDSALFLNAKWAYDRDQEKK